MGFTSPSFRETGAAGAAETPGADPVARIEAALTAADGPAARHVFIALDEARIRGAAMASRARLQAGTPLSAVDGMPVAIKDNIPEAGAVMTAGSALRRGLAPMRSDAAIVDRIRRLGAVPFGRANLSEFAFSGLGLNPHYGTPRNAIGKGAALVPGGSSSGCAVAVALGIVPVALGTDTSGSGRVPAAFNGIVGFRPTRGRYPGEGIFPLAPDLDTPALLGRTVAECARFDALLTGETEEAAGAVSRLVVPGNVVLEALADGVAGQFEAALARLAGAGYRIERKPLAAFTVLQDAMARHGTPVTAEAAECLGAVAVDPRVDRRVRARLAQGRAQGAGARAALEAARATARLTLADELGDACMVFPTVPIPPPRLADMQADDAAFARCNTLVLRNTMLGSLLDTPAISVPFHGGGDHPIGLQFSMGAGRDRPLLALARGVERQFQDMR